VMISLIAVVSGFVATSPLAPATSVATGVSPRFGTVRLNEPSEWEKYAASRGTADLDATDREYRQFKGIDQEFDGGDSGGGVVGDGNTDLEDQHNSATLGALRGGIAEGLGSGGVNVGRGNVQTVVEYNALNEGDEFGGSGGGATSARESSAGANYFGRSTGLADKLISDITEEDLKTGKMDCVRAQQKENWFNQRAIHASNRAQGQGVVFGQDTTSMPREGGYVARDALASSTARLGATKDEISQKDLANHMTALASLPAERLDGEEWAELTLTAEDEIEQTFEVRASPRQTDVTEIKVSNLYNTFAPFRCALLPTASSAAFTVTPNHGTMNRRSGEPTEVVVRFTPQETGSHEAFVVFETEDFKKVYFFIGST